MTGALDEQLDADERPDGEQHQHEAERELREHDDQCTCVLPEE